MVDDPWINFGYIDLDHQHNDSGHYQNFGKLTILVLILFPLFYSIRELFLLSKSYLLTNEFEKSIAVLPLSTYPLDIIFQAMELGENIFVTAIKELKVHWPRHHPFSLRREVDLRR